MMPDTTISPTHGGDGEFAGGQPGGAGGGFGMMGQNSGGSAGAGGGGPSSTGPQAGGLAVGGTNNGGFGGASGANGFSGDAGGFPDTGTFVGGDGKPGGAARDNPSQDGAPGGGGAGGYGAILTGSGTVTTQATARGGNGGDSGAFRQSAYGHASGGDGGVGIFVVDGSTVSLTLEPAADITGGTGGIGHGNGSDGGPLVQGFGGQGVFVANGRLLTNNGTVTGGTGGRAFFGGAGTGGAGVGLVANSTTFNAGTIKGGTGAANNLNGMKQEPGNSAQGSYVTGAGGAGVTLEKAVITNVGRISGGFSGDGTTQADAVDAIGTANSLTLSSGGMVGTLAGGIGISGLLNIDPGTPAGMNLTLSNVVHDYGGPGQVYKAGLGTLTLNATNTYSGGTLVLSGVLDLASAQSAGSGPIGFVGSTATLALDMATQPNGTAFSNVIQGFGSTSSLDLRDLIFTGGLAMFDGTTLSVNESGRTEMFTLSDAAPGTFVAQSDGAGGTLITENVACFVAGTRIGTPDGDVPVEDLAIGDLVVTASGAHRPIRWLGRRSYIGRFANRNPDLLPICFKAGSLANNVPSRDLWVSPKHAMFLDGVLVPAECLVNGASVIKATRVDRVDYHHVELDSHELLLAEGAPSESFVDDEGRQIFQNAQEHAMLYPHAVRVDAVYCAPRLEEGLRLEAIRHLINVRTRFCCYKQVS